LLRLRAAAVVGREMPVRFRDETGAIVERRIDRLVRENGRELVVDYKSGTPDRERLKKDRDQVARYCRAISTITGRECRGLLWYIDMERDVGIEV
ncbi:MAG: PD-(D/E)XK nuclease family protein, partial [Thermoanaerobaculia bacterium]